MTRIDAYSYSYIFEHHLGYMTKIFSWVFFAAALFSAYKSISGSVEVGGYDFHVFYDAAKWYTTSAGNGAFPVLYQGTIPFIVPFTCLDIRGAFVLYSMVNLLATLALFFYLIKKLEINWSLKNPNLDTLYVAIGLFIFISTSPVHVILKTGQISMMAYFLYIYSLLGNCTLLRIVALGSGIALKFSLFTLFLPLMFVKKQKLLVFWGIIVFCIISLSPLLFNCSPWESLVQYVNAIHMKTATVGGVDTYGGAFVYSMVHFEFFKNNLLNLIGKCIFIILGLIILRRESKEPSVFNLESLVALSCITMELSYHRIYDLCFVMVALAIEIIFLLKERNYKTLATYSVFICCFLFIFRFLFGTSASVTLGRFIGENSWIFLCSTGSMYLSFPGYAVMMVFLTLWTSYRYIKAQFISRNKRMLCFKEKN